MLYKCTPEQALLLKQLSVQLLEGHFVRDMEATDDIWDSCKGNESQLQNIEFTSKRMNSKKKKGNLNITPDITEKLREA